MNTLLRSKAILFRPYGYSARSILQRCSFSKSATTFLGNDSTEGPAFQSDIPEYLFNAITEYQRRITKREVDLKQTLNELDTLLSKKEKQNCELKLEITELMLEKNEIERLLKESKINEAMWINERKALDHRNEKLVKLLHQRTTALFGEKSISIVRDALEYIEPQVHLDDRCSFNQSTEEVVRNITKDAQFSEFLRNACEVNKLCYEDVEKSFHSLYHRAGWQLVETPKIVIDSSFWSSTEVFALGAVFTYHHVPFLYYDQGNRIVDFPYKL